ncbi:MAG TPA: response regulator [Chryseosolibacter sp.]|nr:response regulator [Chryseosolibacter sp.]
MTPCRTRFLLADDDVDDLSLFCEAVCGIAPMMECLTVENGYELFDLLSNEDISRPDLIFLDINMPSMNGWECLKKLRISPTYNVIPAIIYSTSSAKKDIDMAYNLGASLFLTKPEDFRELCSILEILAKNPPDSLLGGLNQFQNIKLN